MADSKPESPGKCAGLTTTRAFAALAVVVFHARQNIPAPFVWTTPLFNHGYLAVSYFFVLSGFVMTWTYMDRPVNTRHFFIRRCARIIPLYWAALLLALVPTLWDLVAHGIKPDVSFARKLLCSLTFTQAYVPQYALALNGPGWSLSVEALFYALFPLLLALQTSRPRYFLSGTLVFFLLSQVLHLWLTRATFAEAPDFHAFAMYNPICHLNEFLVGMVTAEMVLQRRIPVFLLSISFWLAATALLIVKFADLISFHDGLLSPLFALLIASVALKPNRFLEWTVLVFLGEISYGIYILQAPLDGLLTRANQIKWHLDAQTYFWLYLISLLGLSAGAYWLIELPAQKLLLKRWIPMKPVSEPTVSPVPASPRDFRDLP